jgi:exopolyphosphatase/guanosine-5'-triphosphate,3'-diphosphate pyrophosphatase
MPTAAYPAPLFAAVELGSDSFRLHLASWETGSMQLVHSVNEPIRLAAGIGSDGCLDAATMRRALACLRQFSTVLAYWQPRAVRVVATAALRVACNAPAFLPAAAAALGYPIEVIGAEEEGRLVYLGVVGTLADSTEARLVLDLGSGSTELAVGRGATLDSVQSFGVGALRHGLTFFREGVSAGAFAAALASARSRFAGAGAQSGRASWRRAYGASGTVRALFELRHANLPALADGDTLALPAASAAQLHGLRPLLVDAWAGSGSAGSGQAERSLARARAAQMAGGLALLLALVDELGIEELVPVQAGLRAGVLRELHARTAALFPYPAPP